jgi:hypothetical protein
MSIRKRAIRNSGSAFLMFVCIILLFPPAVRTQSIQEVPERIILNLTDSPQGFTLNGAAVPANQDKVRLTLTVPPSRIEAPRSMVLEGQARIDSRDVRHTAIPAEDMMQAFAYRHLVPAQEWKGRVTAAATLSPRASRKYPMPRWPPATNARRTRTRKSGKKP